MKLELGSSAILSCSGKNAEGHLSSLNLIPECPAGSPELRLAKTVLQSHMAGWAAQPRFSAVTCYVLSAQPFPGLWFSAHLGEPLTVSQLASHLSLSME